MSDLIRREDAINYFVTNIGVIDADGYAVDDYDERAKIWTERFSGIPSAEPEPEEFEWCTDCKEYDQEKYCCHRWNKVIRKTVEEVKSQYALEYPKIIHCENCKFYTPMNRKLKTGICSLTMHHLGDEGFCSDAEMRRGDR